MNLGYEDAIPTDASIKVVESFEKDVLEESSAVRDFYSTLETAQRVGGTAFLRYSDKKDIEIDPALGKYLLYYFKNDRAAFNAAASGEKIGFVEILMKAVGSSKYNSFKP